MIVLISTVTAQEYNTIKNAINAFKSSSGQRSSWVDNVHLISFNEYRELFAIEKSFIEKCDAILGFDSTTTIDDIIGNVPPARDPYKERLLEISERAKFLLNNWNQKLLTELT